MSSRDSYQSSLLEYCARRARLPIACGLSHPATPSVLSPARVVPSTWLHHYGPFWNSTGFLHMHLGPVMSLVSYSCRRKAKAIQYVYGEILQVKTTLSLLVWQIDHWLIVRSLPLCETLISNQNGKKSRILCGEPQSAPKRLRHDMHPSIRVSLSLFTIFHRQVHQFCPTYWRLRYLCFFLHSCGQLFSHVFEKIRSVSSKQVITHLLLFAQEWISNPVLDLDFSIDLKRKIASIVSGSSQICTTKLLSGVLFSMFGEMKCPRTNTLAVACIVGKGIESAKINQSHFPL